MIFIVLFGIFLAYANGANDNFKGVATLLGSNTTTYKKALFWATLTTLAGSLTALVLAHGLISSFSGRGLVPDSIMAMKSFSLSVVIASALTVMVATKLGFPVSTTHALTGALMGAGFFASFNGVNISKLWNSFFLPLLVSPFIALAISLTLYPLFRFLRIQCGVEKETCICIGNETIAIVQPGQTHEQALAMVRVTELPTIHMGALPQCMEQYSGKVFGFRAKIVLDQFHFVSSGIVSFARGLNDTPKIAAFLLLAHTVSTTVGILMVAIAIALGGILHANQVADTVSNKITSMNAGQGFTANLVTGLLVILASQFGLPVSTTHVSCGALFGIGAVTHQAQWRNIFSIILAWVITLPIAAGLGIVSFAILKGLGV
ncbi:inorganic phosphate transporter [Candidatus Nomurabacteria bacterium]|nr:inorganic phosphate transporter [Candidatus Nomurabacteria bacterium]